jgi:DNA-binding ferritin-like protein
MEVNIDCELMAKYLGCMIALKNFYQSCHWRSKGKGYYGDHLLFERLYEDMIAEVDAFAEKSVAMSGEKSVCPIKNYKYVLEILSLFETTKGDVPSNYELIDMAFNANSFFMQATEKLFDILDKEEELTLGLDDFFTSIYSKHEEHYYLLKQRSADRKKEGQDD